MSSDIHFNINLEDAKTTFLTTNFSVPYQNGIKPQDYKFVWDKVGLWLLENKILSHRTDASLLTLLEIKEKHLSQDKWDSLSQEHHLHYPIVLLNENLRDCQRSEIIRTVDNQIIVKEKLQTAWRHAHHEWSGTAIINYYMSNKQIERKRIEEIHDMMSIKSGSFAGLHYVAFGTFPEYPGATRKYMDAMNILEKTR